MKKDTQVIKFRCPKCNQLLRAEAELAGVEIECPTCSAALRTPGPPSSRAFSDNSYARLSDEELEQRLAEGPKVKERNSIIEELTERFSRHYIELLDKELASEGKNRLREELAEILSRSYSMVRRFLRKLISRLRRA